MTVAAVGATFPTTAAASIQTVTTLNDSGPGSLRAAVAAAGSGDAIVFQGGLNGTITLSTGPITISQDLSIDGPGAPTVTVSGADTSGVFTITAGNVSISGLTLANGSDTTGGAIDNSGTGQLTLAALTATGNTAQTGGAIESQGPLSVDGSTFTGNSAGGAGGTADQSGEGRGGAIDGGSSITISDSTFTGNTAGGTGGGGVDSGLGNGGAIAGSPVTITNSTFTDNTAGGAGGTNDDSGLGNGGAIYTGTATITGSTFTGNRAGGNGAAGNNSAAGQGGAVWMTGALTARNTSFTGNLAGGTGGGGTGSGSGDGGAVEAASVVVGASTFSSNVAGGDGGNGDGSGLGHGGAIDSSAGTANDSVSDSTFNGNDAGGAAGTGSHSGEGDGGAVELASGVTTFASDTIDGNTVGNASTSTGAGLGAQHSQLFKAADTIISANTLGAGGAAANCSENALASDHSLEGPAGQTSCGLDLTSADPQLGALAANGGPTQTQAPTPGSPVIDAVPTAHCPTTVDQRGVSRPESGESNCDLGAYEVQDPSVGIFTPPDGSSFEFGAVPAVAFSCTAGADTTLQSGLNGCSAKIDNGSPVDTGTALAGSVGAHTVTATATDAYGESTTATAGYTVTAAPTNIAPGAGSYTTGYQQSVSVSATLTSTATGGTLQGQSLTFTLAGSESCSATTDSHGIASCSITPQEVPGSYTLAIAYAATTDYQAGSASVPFTVTQVSQSISFTSTAPTGATFNGPSYSVSATASSGLPVTITVDGASAGVCALSGATVTFMGVGTCQLDADQSGNAYYEAASQVTQSFNVAKAQQTVAFTSTPPSHATVGGSTYSVSASATSGLAVVITVDQASIGVCEISGSTVSFDALGTCTLDANQTGNADYEAAPQVTQSFTVNRPPTVALAILPSSILDDGKTQTTATATLTDPSGTRVAGDHVTFTSTDNGQKIGMVTDHGDGTYTVTITASRTVGSSTITATDQSVRPSPSATATLTQISKLPQMTATLQPASIGADGHATTQVVAKLTLSSKPVIGAQLTVRSSDSGNSIGPVSDHGNGTYTATITASRTADTATITVTDVSVGPNVSVVLQLKQVPPVIRLSVKPASIPADSSATLTAVVTAGSFSGPGLARNDVTFAASDPGDSIGPVTDHGNGTYTAVIFGSETPGTVTVTVTDHSPNPNISTTTRLTQF